MSKTIDKMEMQALREFDHTSNLRITTQPGVNWLRVVYYGMLTGFGYFLDGKGGRSRELEREQAIELIAKEPQEAWRNVPIE